MVAGIDAAAVGSRSPRLSEQRPDTGSAWWTAIIIYGPLISTTLLAKWAAPADRGDLAMSWPLIYLAVIAGLATGKLRFDPQRLMLYMAAIAVLGVLQVASGEEFSTPSFGFMAAIYLMYAVSSADSRFDTDRALRFFGSLSTFLAICGIVQFAAQFVLDLRYVFPIENLLPPEIIIQGYNNQAPLTYGSSLYRSNGIFLLEPSFFSQLLGISILVELVGQGRVSRLALYTLALVLSYSGTGIVILAICVPVLVVARRRWDLLVGAAVVIAVLLLFAEQLNLDIFLDRADEFDSPKSSGFERFVGAFYLFEQFLWHDSWRTLFGAGAGMFASYMKAATLPASEMTHAKIIFEFGIVGAAIHFGFLLFCVMRSPAPAIVRLAVVIAFFMAGLYTAASHGLALSLLMWPAASRSPVPTRSADLADLPGIAQGPARPPKPRRRPRRQVIAPIPGQQ